SDQAVGVLQDRLVEIARVGIQQTRLFVDRFDNLRMAVPHMGNIVVRIEERLSIRVVQPDALTSHGVERRVVVLPYSGAEPTLGAVDDGFHRAPRLSTRLPLPQCAGRHPTQAEPTGPSPQGLRSRG